MRLPSTAPLRGSDKFVWAHGVGRLRQILVDRYEFVVLGCPFAAFGSCSGRGGALFLVRLACGLAGFHLDFSGVQSRFGQEPGTRRVLATGPTPTLRVVSVLSGGKSMSVKLGGQSRLLGARRLGNFEQQWRAARRSDCLTSVRSFVRTF